MTTWNSEWATLKDSRGLQIARILRESDSDIIVLTEGCRALLPSDGYVIEGSEDWGYVSKDRDRRKVILWSRHPITEHDTIGHPELPTGRFVSGNITVLSKHIHVIGVCIPWSGAHVRTGRRDREPWQDHNTYLGYLEQIVQSRPQPLMIAGDFNQRIPRRHQPLDSYELLVAAFRQMNIHTIGITEPAFIDHIATSKSLKASDLKKISKEQHGAKLSDHDGVTITLVF